MKMYLRRLRNLIRGRRKTRFSIAEPEDPQMDMLIEALGKSRRREIRQAFLTHNRRKKNRLLEEAHRVTQLQLW